MKQSDIDGLTNEERVLLADSFERGVEKRRLRSVLWSTGLLLVAVILVATSGFGLVMMAILAALVLLVGAVEKLSYQRKMYHHESLTRKLVHRIERLEGVPLTPSHADPARALRSTRPQRSAEPHSASALRGEASR